jgi:hypothetical protein
MTEAVVMVPCLTILWGAVMFSHDRYAETIDLKEEARRCALVTATSGCRGGCGGSGGELSLASTIGRVLPFFNSLLGLVRSIFSFMGDVMRQLDNLGWSVGGGARSVRMPRVLGSGGISLSDAQQFFCREKPFPEPGNVVRRLFCQYTPFC